MTDETLISTPSLTTSRVHQSSSLCYIMKCTDWMLSVVICVINQYVQQVRLTHHIIMQQIVSFGSTIFQLQQRLANRVLTGIIDPWSYGPEPQPTNQPTNHSGPEVYVEQPQLGHRLSDSAVLPLYPWNSGWCGCKMTRGKERTGVVLRLEPTFCLALPCLGFDQIIEITRQHQ